MGRIKGFFAALGVVFGATLAGLQVMSAIGFGPTIGPDVANAALAWLGDPCDGIEHPAYQSQVRREILDGIRAEKNTDTLYVVEVIARRGEWAYVEASPYQGAQSGEFRAYILTQVGRRWGFKWEGQPGARPGQHDYPDGFDDGLLRCKTPCSNE
jgi:hypothetical protein